MRQDCRGDCAAAVAEIESAVSAVQRDVGQRQDNAPSREDGARKVAAEGADGQRAQVPARRSHHQVSVLRAQVHDGQGYAGALERRAQPGVAQSVFLRQVRQGVQLELEAEAALRGVPYRAGGQGDGAGSLQAGGAHQRRHRVLHVPAVRPQVPQPDGLLPPPPVAPDKARVHVRPVRLQRAHQGGAYIPHAQRAPREQDVPVSVRHVQQRAQQQILVARAPGRHSRHREAVRVRALRQGLPDQGAPAEPHPHPSVRLAAQHQREALRLRPVRQGVQEKTNAARPSGGAHGRAKRTVLGVRQAFLHQAVRLLPQGAGAQHRAPLQVHHLRGDLSAALVSHAPPEEARRKGGEKEAPADR